MTRNGIIVALCVWLMAGVGALADEAKDTFEAIYGARVKQVRASIGKKDDLALAAELLASTKEVAAQPALVALLCENAYALAWHESTGAETALAAAELLAQTVPDRKAECDQKILAVRRLQFTRARGTDKRKAAEELVDVLMPLADAKLAAGDAAGAATIYREILPMATILRRSHLSNQLRQQLKACTARLGLDRQTDLLKRRLASDPSNARAAEELVRLYVVQLDCPAKAQPYVAATGDPAWQTYVPIATKPLDQVPPPACVELGQWYAQLAEKADGQVKMRLLLRARGYLKRGATADTLDGPQQLKVKLALKRIAKDLDAMDYTPPGELPRNSWVNLLSYADFESPYVRGLVTRQGDVLALGGAASRVTSGVPIPILVDGSYRVRFQVRWSGEYTGAYLSLPVGPGCQTGIGLGLKEMGFSNIRGIGWSKIGNPTHKSLRTKLRTGRTYAVTVQVLREGDSISLAAALDEKVIIRWKGSVSKDMRGALPRDRWLYFSGARSTTTFLAGLSFMLTDGHARPRKPQDVLAMQTARAKPIPAEETDVRVPADIPWLPIGLVKAKEYYRFEFRGTWDWSPEKGYAGADGTRSDGKYHLQARIGVGKPFGIGSQKLWVAPTDGLLQLGMSDQTGKEFRDNSGELKGHVVWDKARRPRLLVARKTMRIGASPAWTAIGLVAKGGAYRVGTDAEETWRVERGWAGPGGTRDGRFYLQARVAGGEPFKVGAAKAFTAEASGVLEVGMSHQDQKGTGVIRGKPAVWAEPAGAASPATKPTTGPATAPAPSPKPLSPL